METQRTTGLNNSVIKANTLFSDIRPKWSHTVETSLFEAVPWVSQTFQFTEIGKHRNFFGRLIQSSNWPMHYPINTVWRGSASSKQYAYQACDFIEWYAHGHRVCPLSSTQAPRICVAKSITNHHSLLWRWRTIRQRLDVKHKLKYGGDCTYKQLGAQVSTVGLWSGSGWCVEWRWLLGKILECRKENCDSCDKFVFSFLHPQRLYLKFQLIVFWYPVAL